MPFEDIPEPDGGNALKGMLSLSYWKRVVSRLNLWRKGRVVLSSSAQGTAKVIVTEDGWVIDLSKVQFGYPPNAIPLSLRNGDSATAARITVIFGHVDGTRADANMAGGVNYTFAVSNSDKVWVQFPVAVDDSTNVWQRTGVPSIHHSNTLAPATNSLAVFSLGEVTVSGSHVTNFGSVSPGYLSWERCGPEDNFVDKFTGAGG